MPLTSKFNIIKISYLQIPLYLSQQCPRPIFVAKRTDANGDFRRDCRNRSNPYPGCLAVGKPGLQFDSNTACSSPATGIWSSFSAIIFALYVAVVEAFTVSSICPLA